jgi:hypothetical protein
MTAIMWADDLARQLGVDEEAVMEMARTQQVPFAVSTAHPRRLFILKDHLNLWKAAAATGCCERDLT